MSAASSRKRRQRGSVDELPSGALRGRVYAGIDPVTKKRYDLVEIILPGPTADRDAEADRVRMLYQVNERRHPRTSATVAQLLERHLREADLELNTRQTRTDRTPVR